MRISLICLISFFGVVSTLSAQNHQNARKRALDILQKYDQDSFEMIQSYEQAPEKYQLGDHSITLGKSTDFMEYIGGLDDRSILEDLGTAVHEISHGYSFKMPFLYLEKNKLTKSFSEEYSLLFQKSDLQILVKHTPTFPAREMVSSFSEALHSPRFSTYISMASEMQSTQQSGIYGLLDEWNAYFLDTRTAFRMYEYYLLESKQTAADWISFMEGVDVVFYAHLEFKLYILKYLMYAEKNHPEIYRGILNNAGFKEAFKSIDSNFGQLIQDYFKCRDELKQTLRKKGMTMTVKDEFTFINVTGRGNFMNTYNLLLNELSKTEYQNMLKNL